MTNQQLKRLIQKIEVDKDGNVDIYLRLMGDLGLDETILIEDSSKNIETGENAFDKRKNNGSSEMKSGDVSDDFTIPSSNDHT